MNHDSNPQITYITAGAAGMYCGSCMHDNTLAKALNQGGWPTLLVPTYTPIRTDETSITVEQVFFGGINVFLQQKIPLFRIVPRLLDRFLDNPWLIRKVTSRAIETDAKLLGGLTISMLKGKSGNQKKEVMRLVDWLRRTAHPDAVILSNVLIAGFVKTLKKELNVPIVVTLQGDNIFLDSLDPTYKSKAIELIGQFDRYIDAYLVHSRFYADYMAKYLQIDRNKMQITPLGINTSEFEDLKPHQKEPGAKKSIGYLARLTSDKGLQLIVDAFIQLARDPQLDAVELVVAGWLGKDHEEFAQQQFNRLDEAGLSDRYRFLGTVDRKQKMDMLKTIDVLSVPTIYREPKGLYALEAMAAGVPVVEPAHGVFPEMIDDLSGGLLFEPGNADSLAAEIKQLLLDEPRRIQLGDQGRKSVLERRNESSMCQATQEVLRSLLD